MRNGSSSDTFESNIACRTNQTVPSSQELPRRSGAEPFEDMGGAQVDRENSQLRGFPAHKGRVENLIIPTEQR
jgi:hypothetical protein